jgi:hypothetical protein
LNVDNFEEHTVSIFKAEKCYENAEVKLAIPPSYRQNFKESLESGGKAPCTLVTQ